MKMRYIYAIYLKNFETDMNFSKVAKFLNRYLIVVMFIDCSNLNKQKIEVTSERVPVPRAYQFKFISSSRLSRWTKKTGITG